jgi:hypothetical protein
MDDGGLLELCEESRVEEDLSEVMSPLEWELDSSLEVLVRKLAFDLRRRSLKKGMMAETSRGSAARKKES